MLILEVIAEMESIAPIEKKLTIVERQETYDLARYTQLVNPRKAFKLFQKLANFHELCPTNPKAVPGLLKKDVSTTFPKGFPPAQYRLALCFLEGIGIQKNEHFAKLWMFFAAFGGDKNAQYTLGCWYQLGHLVKKEEVSALLWFEEAEERGHENAHIKATELRERISKEDIARFRERTKEKRAAAKKARKAAKKEAAEAAWEEDAHRRAIQLQKEIDRRNKLIAPERTSEEFYKRDDKKLEDWMNIISEDRFPTKNTTIKRTQ